MIHPTYGFGLFKPLATDRLGLTPIEDEVYGMHRSGKAVPRIAAELGIAESSVRDIIVYVWREDSQLFLNMRRSGRGA